MGKKYIIEVEDKPFELLSEDGFTSEKLYRVKGFNSLVFDWNGLNMLTPYTEPDLEQIKADWYKAGREAERVRQPDIEQVRKEAYRQGYDTGYGTKVNEFYEQGLTDAWDAARKIAHCFLWGSYQRETGRSSACAQAVLDHYSASEAIEKIRQYEQEKEESEETKKEQSVTAEDVMRQYLDTFCKGRSCTDCPLCTPDFTCGRGYHFLTKESVSDEEVRRAYAKVLQKMREE